MRTPEEILSESKTIAVVGLSDEPEKPSYGVASYLQRHGYKIIPVNPNFTTVLGETCYPSLQDIPEAVDIVDVFRRPEAVVPIAEAAVAIGAKVFWLQVGIVSEEAAAIARRGGLDVVMDQCAKVVHGQMAKAASR